MLKYLPIAVTALCLTACVLLIVLWVRSYWWLDAVNLPYTNTKSVYLVSLQGGFGGAIKPFRFDQVTVDHSRLNGPSSLGMTLGKSLAARGFSCSAFRPVASQKCAFRIGSQPF